MLILRDSSRPAKTAAIKPRKALGKETPGANGLVPRTYPVTDRGTGETINIFARENARPGHTAIFLHGISAHAYVWEPLQGELVRSLATVAIDQRGHGRSGGTLRHGYSAPDFAEDVAQIIRQLKSRGGPVTLVGHSLGGRNALATAALFPDLVDSVCVLDWSPLVSDETVSTIRTWITAYPDRHASRAALEQFLAEQYPLTPDPVLQTRLDYGFQRAEGAWRPLARLGCVRKAGDGLQFDLRPLVSSIRCPILFVRGTKSAVVDARTWRQTQALWPKYRYVEVDADHQVPEVRPEDVADHLLSFLQDAPQS